MLTNRSSNLNFGVDRRAGQFGSVFFGRSAQPASWHVIIQCPDEAARDALTAVLAAVGEDQVRLLAYRDLAGEELVTIDAAITSVQPKGSSDNLEVVFESNDSVWQGLDVEQVSKTFSSSLDQIIHLPAPGNVPTQPVIRITPTEQRSATTAAVGWQWRQRWMVANNGDEPLFRYPVVIPLGDTTGLTTTKALASGDDLRVWLHGLEQARTLVDWDTAETGVWVIVPALPPGEAITYEIVYGNPQANSAAEDGVELLTPDLPAHDLATSTNYEHHYLTANGRGNAGLGLWPLSSPLEGGSADFGAPGSWHPALTFENPNNSDEHVQPRAQRLEDSAGPWYQARLYAARWRGPGFDNFDPYAGSDPYDGTVLHNPFGISAVRADGIRYRNDAYDKTTVTTTVGDTTETSEVLTPHDPPYTRVVVIGRNSGGENWHVLQEYGNTTIDPLHRLYLQAVTAPPILPTPAAGWERTSDEFIQLAALTQPTISGHDQRDYLGAMTANDDVLMAQYVYALPPGVAFTTGDTVKGQMRAISTDVADARAQLTIRVLAADGTVRATLLGFDTGALANEFSNISRMNRRFPRNGPINLAVNYTTVDGDYLVMEYGFRAHATQASAFVALVLGFVGTSSTGDLPENETETLDTYWPWIEFSTDLSGEGYVTDSPAWTPPSPVKHFGVAVWPSNVVSIPDDAESRASVEATGDITVHIAAESLVIAQIEAETEIYELASELRLHGGGNAVGPYSALLVGNARSLSGPGTPRAALALGQQGLEIDTDRRTHTLWDPTFTTREEALSAHAVRALAGSLREVDATDIPALERIPVTVPNGTFPTDLTGWELHQDDADWTYTVTHDAAVGGVGNGSMKIAATVSDAGTILRRSTTYHAIAAGDSVEVRAWVTQNESGSSSPRLGVAWYDATPTLLATDLDARSAALLNPGAEHELVFAGSPPVGATQFRPVVGVTSTGNSAATKWFDDIEAAIVRPLRYDAAISKVTEEARSSRWLPLAPARRTVPNGDFATDLTGWALEDDGTGITYTATHDAAVGGEANGSLKIAITANTGSDSVVYRTSGFFAVNGAERVEMAAWCVTDDEDLHPRQAIYWYGDESDTALATSLEDDWQPVADAEVVRAFAAIVPPGMTRFRLAVVADAAVSTATGDAHFDDIRLNDNDLFLADVSSGELDVEALVRPRWTP